jgi:putative solute:sodium symporter small subunit
MASDERPQRVRITAPRRDEADRRPAAASGAGDPSALYVRTLIRSQRRLAIVCAVAFIVVLVAVPLAFVLVPSLDDSTVGGIPVSWIVLGAGFFPVLIAIAALYVRTASRNEARYRSLADDDA